MVGANRKKKLMNPQEKVVRSINARLPPKTASVINKAVKEGGVNKEWLRRTVRNPKIRKMLAERKITPGGLVQAAKEKPIKEDKGRAFNRILGLNKENKARGKTKVVFGFEAHYPEIAKKTVKEMEKADVVLMELPQSIINEIKEKGAKKVSSKFGPENREYIETIFPVIEKAIKEGKKVIGYDNFADYKKFIFNTLKLDETLNRSDSSVSEIIKAAEKTSKVFQTDREKEGLKVILKEVEKNKGKKIYIQAGSIHTPLFIELEKKLKKEGAKGVKVSRKFLEEDNFKKGEHVIYPPWMQILRLIRFRELQGKPLTEKDKQLIKKLSKESVAFKKEISRKFEELKEKEQKKKKEKLNKEIKLLRDKFMEKINKLTEKKEKGKITEKEYNNIIYKINDEYAKKVNKMKEAAEKEFYNNLSRINEKVDYDTLNEFYKKNKKRAREKTLK